VALLAPHDVVLTYKGRELVIPQSYIKKKSAHKEWVVYRKTIMGAKSHIAYSISESVLYK
jgi:hypothetical protein